MKWTKPDGLEIETRDTPEIREYAESMGWVEKKSRGRKKKVETDGDSRSDS